MEYVLLFLGFYLLGAIAFFIATVTDFSRDMILKLVFVSLLWPIFLFMWITDSDV